MYGLVGLKTHARIALVVRRGTMACAAMYARAPAITTLAPRASIPTWAYLTSPARHWRRCVQICSASHWLLAPGATASCWWRR
ncbi:MAG: hypothetical protein U0Z44_13815 [Kouleothrix sp.]